ncbi:MAG: pilus assembly protein PilP [Acidithiobacillus sp.]|jgi:type IV pilus assembly protein PilP|uniref:pilus assembly protein PilP n=1 Tax=Acidithiobacillus sp. TaxID=1872118 RepID=UPI0035609CDC
MKRSFRIMMALTGMALLGGCSDSDNLSHLQAFVANGPKISAHVTPLPKTPAYQPKAYENPTNRDPFTSFSELLLRKEAAAASTGPRPASHGPLQPLEKYALSSLSVTGIVRDSQGKLWAVLLTPDHKVYRATVGSYIGTHDGRIVHIADGMTKRSVTVEQFMPNAFGGFQKEQTVLQMQNSH